MKVHAPVNDATSRYICTVLIEFSKLKINNYKRKKILGREMGLWILEKAGGMDKIKVHPIHIWSFKILNKRISNG